MFLNLGGIIYFCLKSNWIKTKVFCAFLYTYWISHYYTIGSHLGIMANTRCKSYNDWINLDRGM